MKEDEDDKKLYNKIANKILSRKDIYDNINLITNAKVPIIKFVEI